MAYAQRKTKQKLRFRPRETELKTGDFISLKNESEIYHTLIIVGVENEIPLVAAHSADEYMRPLNAYDFKEAKGIHILGANII